MSSNEPPPGPPPGPPGGPPGGYGTGPPPGSYPPPPSADEYGHGPQRKNTFAALFDITFSTFVTPSLIKVVYVLVMVVLAFVWLAWIITGFSENAGLGLVALILGGVVLLIYLAFARMTLEFFYAVVRMSEDINRRLPGD